MEQIYLFLKLKIGHDIAKIILLNNLIFNYITKIKKIPYGTKCDCGEIHEQLKYKCSNKFSFNIKKLLINYNKRKKTFDKRIISNFIIHIPNDNLVKFIYRIFKNNNNRNISGFIMNYLNKY